MKECKQDIEEKSGIKRILYVDSGRDRDWMEKVADALRALGEVTVMCWLSEKTIETVRDALETRPFDAMVSHLPSSGSGSSHGGWSAIDRIVGKYSSYGPAFALLHEVRKLSAMPIIVYTGAGMDNIPPISWDSSGVDHIVEKSNDPEADGKNLARWIEYAWSRPPDEPDVLKIERSADGTSLQMETVLCQRGGFGPVLCGTVVKQFAGIPGRIEKLASDGSVEEASELKDLMGLMMLCAYCGSRLRITLDSKTLEAEEALRAAHHLFNQRYF